VSEITFCQIRTVNIYSLFINNDEQLNLSPLLKMHVLFCYTAHSAISGTALLQFVSQREKSFLISYEQN
jgi:hypothetical protein